MILLSVNSKTYFKPGNQNKNMGFSGEEREFNSIQFKELKMAEKQTNTKATELVGLGGDWEDS